jgi:hypothetical protein
MRSAGNWKKEFTGNNCRAEKKIVFASNKDYIFVISSLYRIFFGNRIADAE